MTDLMVTTVEAHGWAKKPGEMWGHIKAMTSSAQQFLRDEFETDMLDESPNEVEHDYVNVDLNWQRYYLALAREEYGLTIEYRA